MLTLHFVNQLGLGCRQKSYISFLQWFLDSIQKSSSEGIRACSAMNFLGKGRCHICLPPNPTNSGMVFCTVLQC